MRGLVSEGMSAHISPHGLLSLGEFDPLPSVVMRLVICACEITYTLHHMRQPLTTSRAGKFREYLTLSLAQREHPVAVPYPSRRSTRIVTTIWCTLSIQRSSNKTINLPTHQVSRPGMRKLLNEDKNLLNRLEGEDTVPSCDSGPLRVTTVLIVSQN